ncbi:hypothetical protein [Roseicella frigidaeris]|uniref:Twin-arginine translocation pathway signal protein n=1 Tax=Roseicella frigidaeris TaxID=2230885 RepID=A0A327MER3_9PROT|nr:hypothetical protein [Roseicella frigidaeris]RAI60564.1 hypothetical protein DOO78_00015 [Roseicella frigidaeris]
MPARPDLSRRDWLRSGLGLLAAGAIGGPAAAMLPAAATLLIPGPEDGALARIAHPLGGALARGASAALRMNEMVLGGPDGVTAANRFATEAAPDGRMLLLLPGAAALARMVGDPRARYDATGCLPVCAVQGPALVVGRAAFTATGPAPRLGLAAPDMAGAAALLGLDLLGLHASPVVGLGGLPAEAALAQGLAEAVLLTGPDLPARLAATGGQPWFTLEPAGQRDPHFPTLPSVHDYALDGPPPLRAALIAASACARLQAALVLPALTPANLVAAWRSAVQRWLEDETRQGLAPGLRALAGADAAPLVAALSPPPGATLAYREWLLKRLGWRPD